jgi:hypothetical protein
VQIIIGWVTIQFCLRMVHCILRCFKTKRATNINNQIWLWEFFWAPTVHNNLQYLTHSKPAFKGKVSWKFDVFWYQYHSNAFKFLHLQVIFFVISDFMPNFWIFDVLGCVFIKPQHSTRNWDSFKKEKESKGRNFQAFEWHQKHVSNVHPFKWLLPIFISY